MALLPDDFFSSSLGLDSGILPMLLMAVVGVPPLHLCEYVHADCRRTGGHRTVARCRARLPAGGSGDEHRQPHNRWQAAGPPFNGRVSRIDYCCRYPQQDLFLDFLAADQIRAATVSTFESSGRTDREDTQGALRGYLRWSVRQ